MSNKNEVRMDDGFSTLITLANLPAVKMFEKEVTPPGISGGGAIDTTTMRNTVWKTSSPRKLKTLTPVSATVAYATEAIDQIMAQIEVEQQITVTFPDTSNIQFWGWVEEFTPSNHTEGTQPTAKLTITPSNHDLSGAEVAPLYTAPEESGMVS